MLRAASITLRPIVVSRSVVSLSDAQKAAQLVSTAVASTRSEIPAHFGVGRMENENACESVHLFMRRTSHTSEEKRRTCLPPTATIHDARASFERMSGREPNSMAEHAVRSP